MVSTAPTGVPASVLLTSEEPSVVRMSVAGCIITCGAVMTVDAGVIVVAAVGVLVGALVWATVVVTAATSSGRFGVGAGVKVGVGGAVV